MDVLPVKVEARSQRKAKAAAQKALAGDEGKNAAPFAGVLNEETGLRVKAGRDVVAGLFSNTRSDSPFFSKYAGSLADIVSRARRLESSYRGAETRHVFGAAVQDGSRRHWVATKAKEADSRPGLLEIEDISVRLLDGKAPLPKEGEKLTQSLFDVLWDKEHPETSYVRADGSYYFTHTAEGAFREGGAYYRPSRPAELYQLARPKEVDPEKILTAGEKETLKKEKGLSGKARKELAKQVASIKAMYTVTETAKVLGSPDEGWAELIFTGVARYTDGDIAKELDALSLNFS